MASDDDKEQAVASIQRGWRAKRICVNSVIFEGVEVFDTQGQKNFMQVMKTVGSSKSLGVGSVSERTTSGQPSGWGDRNSLLSEAIAKYLSDQTLRRLKVRTITGSKLVLRQLVVASGDIPIGQLQPDHLRRLRHVIECWPGHLGKKREHRDLSDDELYELGRKLKVEPPSSETVKTARAHLAAFLDRIVDEKLLDHSPIAGFPEIQPDLTERPDKRPFTPDEIASIFDADALSKWSAGNPHRWWGTLLGLYTGARVAEVAQMKLSDILLQHDMWCMAYRQTVDPDRVHRRHKRSRGSIKNSSSAPIIPIPSQLIELGFLDYIEDVRAAGQVRLFPHLPSGTSRATLEDNGTTYGSALGRQFGSYLSGRIKAEAGMGFHTFRHTAPSEWGDAGADDRLVASITGHEPKQRAGEVPTLRKRYMHGKSPILRARQRDAMLTFQPPIQLPRYEPGQFSKSFEKGAKLYP